MKNLLLSLVVGFSLPTLAASVVEVVPYDGGELLVNHPFQEAGQKYIPRVMDVTQVVSGGRTQANVITPYNAPEEAMGSFVAFQVTMGDTELAGAYLIKLMDSAKPNRILYDVVDVQIHSTQNEEALNISYMDYEDGKTYSVRVPVQENGALLVDYSENGFVYKGTPTVSESN